MTADGTARQPPSDITGTAADRLLPRIVTIASLYGAGATAIAEQVAGELGVPLLGRVLPREVARRAGISAAGIAAVEDEPKTAWERLVSSVGRGSVALGDSTPVERIDLEERRIRADIEERVARAAVDGGVVLGRGGVIVLRGAATALHVYLTAPLEVRVARTMEKDNTDRKAAERLVSRHDRARAEYVRSLYGVDGADPALYHLALDTSAFDRDGCVHLILAAGAARIRLSSSTGAPDAPAERDSGR